MREQNPLEQLEARSEAYDEEQTETVHRGDRRIRDKYPCPKRRAGDAKPRGGEHVSEREHRLYVLIDAHIIRILAQRRREEDRQQS